MRCSLTILAFLAFCLLSGPGTGTGFAQGADVAFGATSHDASLPVEITANSLELDQAAATAVFFGNVRVGQGDLRLAADRIEVFYSEAADGGQGAVQRMEASGNVTFANGDQAAESQTVSYDVVSGIVEMSGDVVLTQGRNALSSETLRIDLATGTGTLDGRVRTLFAPNAAQ